MTSDKTTKARKGRPGTFSHTTAFERVMLGALAGVVGFGVFAAAVFSPAGVSQAPRVAFDLEGVLRLEPVPTVAVEEKPLRALRGDGMTVAEVRQALTYDLALIAENDAPVPRVFLSSMPNDIGAVLEIPVKKTIFFKSVLPLVLQVNERILTTRSRIEAIRDRAADGASIAAEERLWLAVLSDRYDAERGDIETLLRRVDIVPPSLALAQAAKESGWGASRFAQEGNALFGQWTWSKEDGIEPAARAEGEDHLVRQFDTLMDSVRAYARNLNTHRAYRGFRSMRAAMRARGEALDGVALAGGLESYSELGMEYVERIRKMISYNGLESFDGAKLSRPRI